MVRGPEPRGPLRRTSLGAAVVVSVGLLGLLAASSDLQTARLGNAGAALDVAVGWTFVLAGWASPVALRQRLLLGAVGISWLLASVAPVAAVPVVLLAACLALFPQSVVQERTAAGVRTWLWSGALMAGSFAVVATVGQPGASLLFLTVAAVRGSSVGRAEPGVWWRWYPPVAALSVAVVLGGAWVLSRLEPSVHRAGASLVAYELVLVAVAAGHVLAGRSARADLRRRLERLLGDQLALDGGGSSLPALEPVLARAVGDPGLVIRVPDPPGGFAPVIGGREPRRLVVELDGEPVAMVETRATLVDDAETAAAVTRAVRAAARADLLKREQERLLEELVAAEGLAVQAREEERRVLAGRLAEEVLSEIESARGELSRLEGSSLALRLRPVRDELEAAERDIGSIVAGVPPTPLGAGALAGGIRGLARTSRLPVDLRLDPVVTDVVGETALWYACCEGLSNAVKHAGATRVTVHLGAEGDSVVLRLTDDGRGGIDRAGHGLLGLDRRLRAAGGALRVVSTAGEGSSLEARVPRVRASRSQRGMSADEAEVRGPGRSAPTLPHTGTPSPLWSWADRCWVLVGAAVLVGTLVVLAVDGLAGTELATRSTALTAGGRLLLLTATVVVAGALAWAVRSGRGRLAGGLGLAATSGLLPAVAWLPVVPLRAAVLLLSLPPLVVAAAARCAAPAARATEGWLRTVDVLAVLAVLVHAAVYDPFLDPSCGAVCDPVPAALDAWAGHAAALALVVVLTWLSALAGILGGWRRGNGGDGILTVVAATVAVALPASMTLRLVDTRGLDVAFVAAASAAALGAAVLLLAERAAASRAGLTELVDRLEAAGAMGPESLLGRAAFRMPDTDRWVDLLGRPAHPVGAEWVGTAAGTDGMPLIADSVRVRACNDSDRSRLGTAEVVVLLSARQLACARAREIDLATAQRAMADARSDEQRRIGSDLHDGVQQRLVGVLLHCRLAVPTGAPIPAPLRAMERHVLLALDGLRALAGSPTRAVVDAASRP